LSLCLTKNHFIKTYWGSGSIAPQPSHFISEGRTHGTHWTGGWVGSRAGQDAVAERRNPIIAPAED